MAVVERLSKRTKLLDESSSDAEDLGPPINQDSNGFKINEEYAKRFAHNKKREEQHRLEAKYESSSANPTKRKREDDFESEIDDDSSSDESEDDDAELATADVDDEIMATLQAIKSKDPRVYDQSVRFFKEYEADAGADSAVKREEKPMYIQDYHRQNLLAGNSGASDDGDIKPVQTYQDEQDQLKRELVGSMHAVEDEMEEDDFLVAKKKPRHENLTATATTAKPSKRITDNDVKMADKDPEMYLSNFMAARAWLPSDGSRWEAFESDDSDDDKRADEFEEAYNMRFEDPTTANEKLQSFARDVGKHGVRRDEQTGRKRAREREREKKEAGKRERDEDKARLRKLKIEEAQEKVQRIKDAAGLKGQELDLEEWRSVIEGDFDDEKWEAEMKRRFGDDYYARGDDEMELANGSEEKSKSRKPRWEDDINIDDLIPGFDKEKEPQFTLSSDDEDGGVPLSGGEVVDDESSASGKKKKRRAKQDREKEKNEAKRAARQERMKIEEMVDERLPLLDTVLGISPSSSKAPAAGFRYRETSPTSFGLSSRDILFADDAQLNQYAGLKKMAAFRDPEKKRRDKKSLSKKARLREWRRETFGKADEPTGGFERVLGGEVGSGSNVNVEDSSRKKKKRSNKKRHVDKAEKAE